MQLTPEEIARIPPMDRLDLISQLWDSLDAAHVPLTDAQKAELDRRMTTFEHDKQQAGSWEQLKTKLTKACP